MARKEILHFGQIKLAASIGKAEGVITRLSGVPTLSQEQKAAFDAAVVIYSVGTFLAPRAGVWEVEEEVVRALRNPAQIRDYDWQGYVLDCLAQGAADLRHQLRIGCPKGKIDLSGCTIFLLVSEAFNYIH